jgi:hypothetical protein
LALCAPLATAPFAALAAPSFPLCLERFLDDGLRAAADWRALAARLFDPDPLREPEREEDRFAELARDADADDRDVDWVAMRGLLRGQAFSLRVPGRRGPDAPRAAPANVHRV